MGYQRRRGKLDRDKTLEDGDGYCISIWRRQEGRTAVWDRIRIIRLHMSEKKGPNTEVREYVTIDLGVKSRKIWLYSIETRKWSSYERKWNWRFKTAVQEGGAIMLGKSSAYRVTHVILRWPPDQPYSRLSNGKMLLVDEHWTGQKYRNRHSWRPVEIRGKRDV